MKKGQYLLIQLEKEFSHFNFNLEKEYSKDYVPYDEFSDLDVFIQDFFRNYNEDNTEETKIVDSFFKFLNKIFDIEDVEIVNLIDVTILESLIQFKEGYYIAQKYMTKGMYEYFLEEYPYKENKDAWNTSNYYSDEEYQRILNLPDVEDD